MTRTRVSEVNRNRDRLSKYVCSWSNWWNEPACSAIFPYIMYKTNNEIKNEDTKPALEISSILPSSGTGIFEIYIANPAKTPEIANNGDHSLKNSAVSNELLPEFGRVSGFVIGVNNQSDIPE
ncbi:hypothetical protein [Haloarchaeobius sp. DFWS5]|uniref:hypothetical protein n=1 Tax=Haloarchaeobius sp. DFWS5 TaxID=3446114 RepID=UPI003EB936A3